MSKRMSTLLTGAVIAMLAATSIGPASPTSASQVQAQAGCQTFKETGKTVCGKFLNYWKSHGDVAQQGFPISNEFKELSDTDGKVYTVQYFERAVFELHPENAGTKFEVLLSLLGTMLYKQKYPKGAPELPPGPTLDQIMVFPETGKQISGLFMEYWNTHGGLAQQGYPLTNLVSEKSELDGKVYTVQYFQRAVFELHPEKQPPFNVLLSQLGTFQYKRKYPNGAPTGSTSVTNLPAGQWGGKGIGLWIDGKRIHLDYDCAHGTIDGVAIPVDASGRFSVQGTHTPEFGASERAEVTYSARYTGMVQGNSLTLTVTYANANPANPGATGQQVLGPFTLILNAEPVIRKCQ